MGYMIDSDILLNLIHIELTTFLSSLSIMIPEDRRRYFEIAIGGIIKRAGEWTDAEAHEARGLWINIDDVKRDLNATCFARREEGGELIALESLEMYAEMRGRQSASPKYTELSPDDVALELSPGDMDGALGWCSTISRLIQAGYVICRKENR